MTDLNRRPENYEFPALTCWAKRPKKEETMMSLLNNFITIFVNQNLFNNADIPIAINIVIDRIYIGSNFDFKCCILIIPQPLLMHRKLLISPRLNEWSFNIMTYEWLGITVSPSLLLWHPRFWGNIYQNGNAWRNRTFDIYFVRIALCHWAKELYGASCRNRTDILCLEGRYNNHYTNEAWRSPQDSNLRPTG